MACYSPIRAVLSSGPDGRRRLSFGSPGRGKMVSLPCGRCIGCRLERARQWAVRIMHEAKMHDESSFLTLTYAELPKGCRKCAPGVAGSLCVCEVQRFLKRLRERVRPTRIRFFLCGEYGEKLGRPHYHAIVFGWFPPDAVLVKRSGELAYYESAMLRETWGLGNASVGLVSFDSAAYVANYATKKVSGPDATRHYQGRRPEFLLMSRRPGIGRRWLDAFQGDVYPSDEVIVRGVSCRPPRYYDSVVEARAPEVLARVRADREAAASALEEYELPSGEVVSVAPSRNARRLAVREKVARAKAALKSRKLESA